MYMTDLILRTFIPFCSEHLDEVTVVHILPMCLLPMQARRCVGREKVVRGGLGVVIGVKFVLVSRR